MRIVVCVKQVPASNEVALDPKTNTIIRDSRNAVINPFDSHALETALMLKEHHGADVSVLSMGIPACVDMLRDCVSRGADRRGNGWGSHTRPARADARRRDETAGKGVY